MNSIENENWMNNKYKKKIMGWIVPYRRCGVQGLVGSWKEAVKQRRTLTQGYACRLTLGYYYVALSGQEEQDNYQKFD